MKTYSVVTTPMQQDIAEAPIYFTQHDMDYGTAKQRFNEAKERFNLDNEDWVLSNNTAREAGGIGYDYRVELFESI